MKKSLLFFAAAFYSLFIYGQDGPKVVVFNSPENNEKALSQLDNSLKLSGIELLVGDVALYFERAFSETLSSEIGIGFTTYNFFSENYDYSSDKRNYLIGHSFAIGIRYYPFDVYNDFYFSPQFKYRYYHNSFDPTGNHSYTSMEEYEKLSIYRFTVGYVERFSDKIMFDFHGGIGYTNAKSMNYVGVMTPTGGSYQPETDLQLRLHLSVGIKCGYMF